MKAPTETALVKACVEYLALRGGFAWRNNSGAMKIANRYVAFGSPGSPDVIGVIGGRMVAVECKSATGRLRSEQKAFLDRIRAKGGLAVVVRSLEQLAAALDAEGL